MNRTLYYEPEEIRYIYEVEYSSGESSFIFGRYPNAQTAASTADTLRYDGLSGVKVYKVDLAGRSAGESE